MTVLQDIFSEIEPSYKNLTVGEYNQKNFYGKLKPTQNEKMQQLTKPHIDSFNWFLLYGVKEVAKSIKPMEIRINKDIYAFSFSSIEVIKPTASIDAHCKNNKVYPYECRMRGTTYSGKIKLKVEVTKNGEAFHKILTSLGNIPMMVKSSKCHLYKMSPTELVRLKEESEEMGGYFVGNGNEKVVRMLTAQRRNYPLALSKKSYENRGKDYSEFAISLKSVSADQSIHQMFLHYLNTGNMNVCVFHLKQNFFIPLIIILKCLVNYNDSKLIKQLEKGSNIPEFSQCVKEMLLENDAKNKHLKNQNAYLGYLGDKFKDRILSPTWESHAEIGKKFLDEHLLVHLDNDTDKFNLMCYMAQKLFCLAKEKCLPENPDSSQHHEILLSGHLFTMILKKSLLSWQKELRLVVSKSYRFKSENSRPEVIRTPNEHNFDSQIKKFIDSTKSDMCFKPFLDVICTGNLQIDLGLMQDKGLSVIADKLNFMRYASHFRAVHRGQFFTTMRTTTVRKLLPETWGFLCCVHTPDGTPCGLLNHMTYLCEVVDKVSETPEIDEWLKKCMEKDLNKAGEHYPVLFNGKRIGFVPKSLVSFCTKQLRYLKTKYELPLEICLVPFSDKAQQYPSLYLFYSLAQMKRPVRNIYQKMNEYIGTFEQVYLDICVKEEEKSSKTTHQELTQDSILSFAASLTPFSDYNQSPRNMYQCQMGKQTMGTAAQAIKYRADNKLYNLESPQSPMVRPYKYDQFGCDEFPSGTNAIVAVISYSGYTMEDAVTINKASHEKGFCRGSIYKSEILSALPTKEKNGYITFGVSKNSHQYKGLGLDDDGLPYIGQRLTNGCNLYSTIDNRNDEMRVVKYKGLETAYVENLSALGNDKGLQLKQKVRITYRIERNTIIGDKFASRAGQKGICAQFLPIEDMPFTQNGMTPDIIFNPHGFPSRMTIGMMIEFLAGKSASMHGHCYDATPFTFNEKDTALNYFEDRLRSAGFNSQGLEYMANGKTGEFFEVQIFIGPVYYQRLRHMVSDKFQCRTTGPVDQITQQPVQGRKRKGGVRFGEMERDALIAHGCSSVIQDRLMNCSDYCQIYACKKCGLFATRLKKNSEKKVKRNWVCQMCGETKHLGLLEIPFVFFYLSQELSAMNIKMKLNLD